MLDYVYGHDEIVGRFVASMIPHIGGRMFGACKTIGVIEDGSLVAGIVYHNYDPEAGLIEISGAALPGVQWLTRETIRRQYQYPFHQCGVQMIVQRNPADNERLLRQLASYEYMFIRVPRMFGRDKDGVLCLLTYEAWAGNRFNKRFKHHLVDTSLVEVAA
jgi:hypothetical protein